MTINEILEQLNQDILKFAMHISNDYHKGNDLYQDAVLKALENEHVFEGLHINQVKAWFFRTIKNKHIDEMRKETTRSRNLIHVVEQDEFEDELILEMLLKNLPIKQQEALRLKYLHGYKSHEMANIMTMNPSTIRNHVSGGIAALKEFYREEK